MFKTALIESNHAIRTTSRWPAVISIALQATVAAALLSIPLVHPEVLTPRSISLPLAPPPIPRAPEPPPQRVRLENAASTSLPTIAMTEQRPLIGIRPVPLIDTTDGPPVLGRVIIGDGPGTGLNMSAIGTAPSGPHVAVATPSGNTHAGPANISRGVAEGLLLTPIRPEYPHIAVISRVSGTVTVAAIISRSGTVESAHAVNGPEMLRSAAVDAVRSARYRPYLLNGQPTEVEATYTINFNLSSN